MANYSVQRIDDIEAIAGGAFRRARAALGVRAFGLQVLDLPPNAEAYPAHDHGSDGQEEVYLTISGGGEIEIEGERHPLNPDVLVRVGPGVMRKLWPGPEGARVVAIGGVPGKPFEPLQYTELGEPDPFAG